MDDDCSARSKVGVELRYYNAGGCGDQTAQHSAKKLHAPPAPNSQPGSISSSSSKKLEKQLAKSFACDVCNVYITSEVYVLTLTILQLQYST